MNEISESDYLIAACADIAYEGLDADTVMNAWIVSENAEGFFEAIQAAIWLKGMRDET